MKQSNAALEQTELYKQIIMERGARRKNMIDCWKIVQSANTHREKER